MPPDEPVELPGLAAQRRGPGAAVCTSGHVIAWFIEPSDAPKFCMKCGDPILLACPGCNAGLPGDAEMLAWVPYHTYCGSCGNAFPWRAGDIAQMKRTLADQAETEGWSEDVRSRASALLDDIVADRAAPSSIVAGMKWLSQHGADSGSTALLDAIERLASPTLKQGLRPQFPGLF